MTCESSNPVGRPRYDRMKIVKDFVEWAKTNHDAWTVPQYATSIGINSLMMNQWAAQEGEDSEFSIAFIQGKEIIGMNRLKASIPREGDDKPLMDRGIYLRGLGNYDKDINVYERGERKFDIETKANVDRDTLKTVNTEIVERLDRMHNQMSSLQESASNKAANKIKSEA